MIPDPPSFSTATGQRVSFRQLTIRDTTQGYLEGSGIYDDIRARIGETVADVFGQDVTFHVEWPSQSGPLPAFTWLLDLVCYEASSNHDFTQLVLVRFFDALPRDLPQELAAIIGAQDWESNASGGCF